MYHVYALLEWRAPFSPTDHLMSLAVLFFFLPGQIYVLFRAGHLPVIIRKGFAGENWCVLLFGPLPAPAPPTKRSRIRRVGTPRTGETFTSPFLQDPGARTGCAGRAGCRGTTGCVRVEAVACEQMATVRHIHLPFSKKVCAARGTMTTTTTTECCGGERHEKGHVRPGWRGVVGEVGEAAGYSDSEIPLKRLTDDKRPCHAHSSYSTGPQIPKTTPREKPSPYTYMCIYTSYVYAYASVCINLYTCV